MCLLFFQLVNVCLEIFYIQRDLYFVVSIYACDVGRGRGCGGDGTVVVAVVVIVVYYRGCIYFIIVDILFYYIVYIILLC